MNSAPVNITILADNRAGDELIAEHGLSLWIEADGRLTRIVIRELHYRVTAFETGMRLQF